MHLGLYLKKYQKLEKQGLIEIDLTPENGLEYDCHLTGEGEEILDEIAGLERDWEEFVGISQQDIDVLINIALNSFVINYKHKKKQNFIF